MSRLIAGAAQLKPDVRLGQAVSEFKAALNAEQKQRYQRLSASGEPPKAADVVKLAEEVNKEGSSKSSSWKPHGTRIQNALSHIQALTAVGDLMVGGSQNIIACGVWSAVRLALLYSVSYLSLFEKIADKLVRVGRTASIHKDMVGLFPRDSTLRDMVCEYLIIIVDLSRSFITFRTKNALAQYVSTFNMDKELQGSEDKLTVWAKLINEQVQFLHSQVTVNMSNKLSLTQMSQELFNASWKVEKDQSKCMQLVRSLSPEQDRFDRTWQRHRRKGTVNWLFDTDDWVKWTGVGGDGDVPDSVKDTSQELGTFKTELRKDFTQDSLRNKMLLIVGGLGKGKTVLMANIVSQLMTIDESAVAHLFCDRFFSNTLDPDIALASLAHQVVKVVLDAWSLEKAIPRKLPPSFLETTRIKDEKQVTKLITDAIQFGHFFGIKRWFVVIDGLDHMQRPDAEYVMKTLSRCQKAEDTIDISICISLRSDSWLKAVDDADHVQYMHIVNAHYDAELRKYVQAELETRRGFRELSSKTQENLATMISDLSEGMYIWATLQIEHLFPSYSETVPSERDILSLAEHLPKALGNLFDEALQSITDTRHQPRVFELVMAARRPLTIGEILVALSINPDIEEWDEEDIPTCHDPSAMVFSSSGGLLELDEQDYTVHFVHHSVFYHLTDATKLWTPMFKDDPLTWRYSLSKSDLSLGKTCLKYLELPLHDRRVTKSTGTEVVNLSVKMASMPKYLEDSSSLMKPAGWAMRHLPRRSVSPSSLDMMKIVEEYLDDQRKLREKYRQNGTVAKPSVFLDYASTYWVYHCDHFLFDIGNNLNTDSLDSCFRRAVRGECLAPTKLPFSRSALFMGTDDQFDAAGMENPLYGNPSMVFPVTQTAMSEAIQWILRQHHMRMAWTFFDSMIEHKIAHRYKRLEWLRKNPLEISPLQKPAEQDAPGILWNVSEAAPQGMLTPFLRIDEVAETAVVKGTRLVFDFAGLLRLYDLQKTNRGFADMVKHQAFLAYMNPTPVRPRVRQLMARIGTLLSSLNNIKFSKRKGPPMEQNNKFKQNNKSWMLSVWGDESMQVTYTSVRDVVERAMKSGLGDDSDLWDIEFLRPMLTLWWGNLSNSDRAEESAWLADTQIFRVMENAKVPCHLMNRSGTTILAATLPISHLPFRNYCTECTWADHGPVALRMAIRNLRVDVVVTLASRGALGDAGTLFNKSHSYIDIGVYEEQQTEDKVDAMVVALIKAKLNVRWERLLRGPKQPQFIRIEPGARFPSTGEFF